MALHIIIMLGQNLIMKMLKIEKWNAPTAPVKMSSKMDIGMKNSAIGVNNAIASLRKPTANEDIPKMPNKFA